MLISRVLTGACLSSLLALHHNLGLLFTSRQAFRGRGSSLLVVRASRLRGLEARAFPAGVRLSFQATFIRQPQLTVMNHIIAENYR